MKKDKIDPIVDFLFEIGILAKTPRSGFFFLGSGDQSVAEHINRVIYIGFTLAQMAGNVDLSKVLQMCMFHDLAEARVSDLNYVHQKYTERFEHKAINDLASTLPFGDRIKDIIAEYEKRESKESKLAKDADNLEWILSLKEQKDIGNERSSSWIPSAVKRLKTKEAQILATKIVKTDSDHWWFGDKKDKWWVDRKKK
jgi:putative hydrolase of HD superfamily